MAARKGAIVKQWSPLPSNATNPYSLNYHISDLLSLITSKTRIVAFTACSNILGSIIPVAEVVKAVREEAKAQGARKVEISLDCVAYAPHRVMDVKKWDVDFCVFSFYKVWLELYMAMKILELKYDNVCDLIGVWTPHIRSIRSIIRP